MTFWINQLFLSGLLALLVRFIGAGADAGAEGGRDCAGVGAELGGALALEFTVKPWYQPAIPLESFPFSVLASVGAVEMLSHSPSATFAGTNLGAEAAREARLYMTEASFRYCSSGSNGALVVASSSGTCPVSCNRRSRSFSGS